MVSDDDLPANFEIIPPLKINPSGGRIAFHNASAGREVDAYRQLKDGKGTKVRIFKALGDSDIVTLEDTEHSLDSEEGYDVTQGCIASSRVVNLIKWKIPNYSQDLVPWIGKQVFLGLILLDIDKPIFSRIKVRERLPLLLSSLVRILNIDSKKLNFYGAFGHSDIYLLLKPESVLELFQILGKLRSIRVTDVYSREDLDLSNIDSSSKKTDDVNFHLFSQSLTFPLFSFEETILAKKYSNLTEEVRAYVNIRCAPGSEKIIRDHPVILKNKKFRITSTFGTGDIKIETRKKIELGELLNAVLVIREKFSKLTYGGLVTETYLHEEDQDIQRIEYFLNPGVGEFKVPTALKELDLRLYVVSARYINYFQSLQINNTNMPSLKDMEGIAHRIISGLDRHILAVNAISSDWGAQSSLQEKVALLEKVGKKGLFTFDEISTLSEVAVIGKLKDQIHNSVHLWINSSAKAISQRVHLDSNNYKNNIQYLYAFTNIDGQRSSILAIEKLINFIYQKFFASFPYNEDKLDDDFDNLEENSWLGFVYSEEVQGFRLKEGHIYSFPETAAHEPISNDKNWLTFTHEFSHDVYTRHSIEEKLSLHRRAFSQGIGVTAYNEDGHEAINSRAQYFEIFATYFDYYHFYNEEMDFFQRNIWNCWLIVPIVRSNLADYINRSFVIYLLQDVDKFMDMYVKGEDRLFVEKSWPKYVDYMRGIVGDKVNIESYKKLVVPSAKAISGPFCLLIRHFLNPSFRDAINQGYKGLEKHIDSVFSGEVICTEIENPYLLLKECTKRANSENSIIGVSDWCANSSLILSLRES